MIILMLYATFLELKNKPVFISIMAVNTSRNYFFFKFRMCIERCGIQKLMFKKND